MELVNPGSVGMPFDGDPRAAYALVHDDGPVEHRRVAYDHEATAARVRSLGGSWAETVVGAHPPRACRRVTVTACR